MQPDSDDHRQIVEEMAMLRRRLAELEQQLPEARRSNLTLQGEGAADQDAARAELSLLFAGQAAMLDALPAMVFFKDRDHRYLMVNKAYADHYRLPAGAIIGKRDEEIFLPETARGFHESDEATMAAGVPRLNVELRGELADGTVIWSMENDVPYRDASGRVAGMVGVLIDVTDRKRAEEALQRTQTDLLAVKEILLETISALSTPVLPIADGVIIMPLIGHIDSTRSAQIMDALLDGVQRYSAEFVIMDLTGVPVIDSAVASHLLRAAYAVHLLGTQCILVGISGAIAQSLIHTGIDFQEFTILRNLRAGVRYALARRRRIAHAPGATVQRQAT
jgi:rsbT co-antagonist protein RsbR